MLLLIPTLLAIVLALLAGGSPRHLAALPLRNTELIMASFLIQVLIYMPHVRDSALVLHWGGAIYVGALALALVGALRNWRLGVAVRVATLGLALNALAIAANGGYMPTNAAAMAAVRGQATVQDIAARREYNNTHLATGHTRLTFLSDVLPVRVAGGIGNVYSIGDVLIGGGAAALAFTTMRPLRRRPVPALAGAPSREGAR